MIDVPSPPGAHDPPLNDIQLHDIELRVSSAQAWLDKCRAALKTDRYFAKILAVLTDGTPNIKVLLSHEAKDWRKAVARSKNFRVQDGGLLYRSTDDCGTVAPRLCIQARLIPEIHTDAHDAPDGVVHNRTE